MKKTVSILFIVISLLLSSCNVSKEEAEKETEATEYIIINEINGNEINYNRAEKKTLEVNSMKEFEGGRGNNADINQEKEEISGNGPGQAAGAMPERVVYEAAGESMTTMIPVGTAVYTADGKLTNFSRLAAGNTAELVFAQNDNGEMVIVQVNIVE